MMAEFTDDALTWSCDYISSETGPSGFAKKESREVVWPRTPDPWKRTLTALARLPRENDWDGEGAPAPDPDVIRSVELLLERLRHASAEPPSRILALPDGGVLIEWQSGKVRIEIEVCIPFEGEEMVVQEGQAPAHRTLRWTAHPANLRAQELFPEDVLMDAKVLARGVDVAWAA